MSRIAIPFFAGDISALARSLREQLTDCDHTPGHVELLNMLARSTGHRNFQSLRAQQAAKNQLDVPPPPPEPVDYVQVRHAARHFDATGSLANWPAKSSLQELCLWVLWSKLTPKVALAEEQLNRQIRALHGFGDHALLRRELCDRGLVARTPDGRNYRRVERAPSPVALALIRQVAETSIPAPAGSGRRSARRAQ